jgi:Holliday junction resolvasome RuvABC endonuclease subunit
LTFTNSIIVCLDLALANTGVAVISVGSASDTLLHVDTIHTEKSDKSVMRKLKIRTSDDEWRRTKELVTALEKLLLDNKPRHVFIECPTGGSKNAQAAKSMAIARGAACAVMSNFKIPVTLVTPFEAKKAATGENSASKNQVKSSVIKEFPLFTGWIKGKRGQVLEGRNEHVYDALSVYTAAKQTTIYKEIKNDSINHNKTVSAK